MNLRAATLPVSYLDDSSLHEQMVRFATAQLGAGQLPLTSWFPYLGLGSPLFLHYQSLPAMLAGALGLVIGPDAAFRWSLYLLLSLWPLSVYFGARLFGAGRAAAATSAAIAPFLWSATGIGYEQHAYLWTGFGVWTQLWASITLPLAWGLSWRAIRDGRHTAAAVALTALTVALHFETGYLALTPILLWPLAATGPLARRCARAAVVLAGSLLASAWVIVPLLAQRDWAAQNEILRGTPLVNGYGATRILGWLVSGQLLDHGRLPVVTLLAAVGLALAVTRCAADADARALLVALVACLLLSFGRATFGSLAGVIPGSGDIFFRRFSMGVQLVALMLAGPGAAWVAEWAWRTGRLAALRAGSRSLYTVSQTQSAAALAGIAALVAVLAPAWIELGAYDARTAAAIATQRRADATEGADLDRLLARIPRAGGGRIYAGEPTNWGAGFTVGSVPVFKYLESRDVDEVGYTLRTASLMSGPEYYFDDTDPSDYLLFGIRYLIVPAGYRPPVHAHRLAQVGSYTLWTVAGGGYVHGGRLAGRLRADRTNIGARSIQLLHAPLAQNGTFVPVTWDPGRPGPQARTPAGATLPGIGSLGEAGSRVRAGSQTGYAIRTEAALLSSGYAAVTAHLKRAGVVVLSASDDPGWTATVDGHRSRTTMIAPALVGVRVGAGTHRIVFRFHGYDGYPLLLALSALTLIGFGCVERRRRPDPG